MKERSIGWEMAKTKFVIIHGEVPCSESLVVFLLPKADRASTPTGVDKFPLAIVDLDGVPGMGAIFSRDGLTWLKRGEAGAFSMATNDEGLEAGVGSDGGEEASIAFADG